MSHVIALDSLKLLFNVSSVHFILLATPISSTCSSSYQVHVKPSYAFECHRVNVLFSENLNFPQTSINNISKIHLQCK